MPLPTSRTSGAALLFATLLFSTSVLGQNAPPPPRPNPPPNQQQNRRLLRSQARANDPVCGQAPMPAVRCKRSTPPNGISFRRRAKRLKKSARSLRGFG